VPLEALSPHRVPAFERPAEDPAPLPYLASSSRDRDGIDLTLEVYLQSEAMRQQQMAAMMLSRSNLRDLYQRFINVLSGLIRSRFLLVA